ncbi:MAG: hypothetical protein ACOCQQ_01015 [Candidatus Nanoarchaeia archaeon]
MYKKQLFLPSAKISKQLLLYKLQRSQNSFPSYLPSTFSTSFSDSDYFNTLSDDKKNDLEKDYSDIFFSAS